MQGIEESDSTKGNSMGTGLGESDNLACAGTEENSVPEPQRTESQDQADIDYDTLKMHPCFTTVAYIILSLMDLLI